MLSSVEQAFVGREDIRAPLKTPAWEAKEHLKTMVYAKLGGQTECIMGNWKIENWFLCK